MNIANLASKAGTIEWHSSGLAGTPVLGGSGTEPAGHCSLRVRTFNPGHEDIVVSSGTDSVAVSIDAPEVDQPPVELWFVIREDGTVEQITAESAPPSPYCPTEESSPSS